MAAEARAPDTAPATTAVTPAVADPAPLGLAALGLTLFLFSGVNSNLIHTGGLIFVGMALLYGGLAQFLAGMWEFRNRNTFGATAFSSIGALWMGLGIVFVFDTVGRPTAPFIGNDGLIWFYFAWAVFLTYILVASLRTNGAVVLALLLLAATFWILWIGGLKGDTAGHGWTGFAGWAGFATAVAAFYGSFAGVVNSTFGKVILPVFPLTGAGS